MAMSSLRPGVRVVPRVCAPAVARAITSPAVAAPRRPVLARLGKTELTHLVAQVTGLTKKDTAATLEALLEVVQNQVAAGERVSGAPLSRLSVNAPSRYTGPPKGTS